MKKFCLHITLKMVTPCIWLLDNHNNFLHPHQVIWKMKAHQVIPDSLTTIHQYLSFMRNEFFREGVEHRNEPDPLKEILLSTRELLMMLADGYISQFTRHLVDQANLMDPLTRGNLQNSVFRAGILLQNLGSLLLDLGRITLTLRFGERPSDAAINAGPAVFMSASGPNPVMVQPVPFFSGSNFSSHHMGAAYTGHGLQGEPLGTTFVPGNITIHLRAGRTVPVSPHNLGTRGGQGVQETTNPTENSSTSNVVPQAVYGASDDPSLAGDSGVRVLAISKSLLPSGKHKDMYCLRSSSLDNIYLLSGAL